MNDFSERLLRNINRSITDNTLSPAECCWLWNSTLNTSVYIDLRGLVQRNELILVLRPTKQKVHRSYLLREEVPDTVEVLNTISSRDRGHLVYHPLIKPRSTTP